MLTTLADFTAAQLRDELRRRGQAVRHVEVTPSAGEIEWAEYHLQRGDLREAAVWIARALPRLDPIVRLADRALAGRDG